MFRGATVPAPKGWGFRQEFIPRALPPVRGLRERCKLPQRGQGRPDDLVTFGVYSERFLACELVFSGKRCPASIRQCAETRYYATVGHLSNNAELL